ncbi:Receptor-like protein kinase FERONIA [Camellia lanceoleosa]|uniref:Receptor-like protein kinase FERONIA n=1 Tax=Camellia lanceoleosa TaxID=1840588 RepID=A0ACC0G1Y6_9ERIC|nr:Receptor-like protein kinase FERONIA [Camellia lanceoleosa]
MGCDQPLIVQFADPKRPRAGDPSRITNLLEMSCPDNHIANLTIPVVMISKSGGVAINKSMTSGKRETKVDHLIEICQPFESSISSFCDHHGFSHPSTLIFLHRLILSVDCQSKSYVVAKGIDLGWRTWKNKGPKNGMSWQLCRDPFADVVIQLYHRFSLAEIQTATNNFHEPVRLRGDVKVYRGHISSGNLEVAIKRKPMIYSRDEDQVNLVRWFKTNIKMGTVDQIIAPYLIDKIAPKCLKEYVMNAENCVCDKGIERPSMDDVLGNLRYALQLQETWQNSNDQFSTVKSLEAVPSSDGTVIVELARRGDIDEMSLGIIGDSDYFSGNLAR